MKRKPKKPYDDEYTAILLELAVCPPWDTKRMRRIHRRLKPYGEGVPFSIRYPRALIWTVIVINLINIALALWRLLS